MPRQKQSAAHIQREGSCQRPVQPICAAAAEAASVAPAPLEALALAEAAQPVERPKPAAEHPWRQKNRATKAAIAQAHAQARL